MQKFLAGAIGALITTLGLTAMAYEEAGHRVIESTEFFEVREYVPMLVAEVEIEGDSGLSASHGFRILFSYISGNNVASREIAMTVPVLEQDLEGVEMERTGPLMQTGTDGDDGRRRFGFVMPRQFSVKTVPMPVDERVRIVEIPTRTMAVRRFSGTWFERNYLKNESRLLESVREAGLEVIGEPLSARYDSPFTPWFLRRNEVMVEIGEVPMMDGQNG